MSVLTIHMRDEECERLKTLAAPRATSVNRLIDEMATVLLAAFDAETRFQLRSECGRVSARRGAELLRKAKGA